MKHYKHRAETRYRDYVEYIMRIFEPDGFATRDPNSKKIKRGKSVSIGPHEEWSGDGHDQLCGIGFPVYGIRDKWSGKWLGLWVVPNNRLANVVAYLWLCVMAEYHGKSTVTEYCSIHHGTLPQVCPFSQQRTEAQKQQKYMELLMHCGKLYFCAPFAKFIRYNFQ